MSRHLTQLDLIIVALYLLLIFTAGLLLTRRASSSVDEFFIGGRGWSRIAAASSGGPGRALRNWLIALAALFGFNFGLGWLLLR